MADVFRAYDRRLGREVALKIMRPALSVDRELVDRFDREAEVIARIAHRNVVAVTDHGTAGEQHYMAMQLVDGPTLQQLLLARARLGQDEAIRIAHDVAAGLAAAHDAGIIHRDLKPANILIAPDGHALVSDFGIAHLEAMTQLTRTGEVLGTPRYIAPEQVTGGVDARSDVYSAGIVLYEMLAGRPPFDGGSPLEIVRKHLRERPIPPRRLVPHVGRGVETVVMRALQKDPAKRFPSAAAFHDSLRAVEAPAIALASRTPARVPGRAMGAVLTCLGLLLTLAGVALAAVGGDPLRGLAASAATVAPARATSVVTARPTERPTAAPATATATSAAATPAPTAAPATPSTRPTPTPTKVQPSPARSAAPVPATAATTIARFYELVTAGRYDEAATLWSARMRAAYPPATNIYGRFGPTQSISLTSWSIAAQSTAGATVNVEIKEVMNDGSTRRWVGQWYVVNAGATWLMDQPWLGRA